MHAARRGLTFVEVIAAVAMLALIAATIVSGLSFVDFTASRDRARLAAMEVAHRVVLQFLDNPVALPDPSLPYDYLNEQYRWVLRLEILTDDLDDKSAASRRTAKVASGTSIDEKFRSRLYRVTVEVYRFDDADAVATGDPLAHLERIYNQFADRNDPEREKQRILKTIEDAFGQKLEIPEAEKNTNRKNP
ncbi:MAG TPA: hypothetical protein VG797_02485 [Phycisphaerales bacterium]|nr:hypothetical protein [Phycisphaerales bacterium]